mmetsp:Transcript_17583/g.31705  ORF Transcript_17583/g.31705 Transcript_17583/m.31705 type:complete len:465 (-) Transcript_17583:1383-2777(-)
MLQYFSYRMLDHKPILYTKAFEHAVAAEARRLKEVHFKEFVESMNKFEAEFPVEEERLLSIETKTFIDEYEEATEHMQHLEDVQNERLDLLERLQEYVNEVKMVNYNKSYDICAEAFDVAFAPSDEDFKTWWTSGCTTYHKLAKGPCEASYFYSCLEDLGLKAEGQMILHSTQVKLLYEEIEELRRQKDEAMEESMSMRHMLDESLARHSSLSKAKEKRISDLQTSVSLRVVQAEERVRELGRELQHTKLELENALIEKEALVERERERHLQAVKDAEERGKRFQNELMRLERDFADYIRAADKTEIEPIMMTTEETQVGDTALINCIKTYASELAGCFANVAQERSKSVKLLDQLARTQTELHRAKLQEQNTNLQAAAWQERFEATKAEQQDQLNRFAASLERHNAQLRDTLESVSQETSKRSAVIAQLQVRLSVAECEKEELRLEVELLQKQVETAYEVQAC